MVTTALIRSYWDPPCNGPFVRVDLYGEGRVQVRPQVVEAVKALSAVLRKHSYETRLADTGAYNCRKITGGTGYSLHAYGVALDINWLSNPYGPTLKTDMPPAMVREIKALRTNSGAQVWRWGGDYAGNKDAMHFEVIASPRDLKTGLRLPDPTPPTIQPETDDMPSKIIKGTTLNWYISDGVHKRNLGTATITKSEEAGQLVYAGFATWDNGQPFVLDQDLVNNIRTV